MILGKGPVEKKYSKTTPKWSTNHKVVQDVQVAFYILPVGDQPLQEYSDILVSESLYFLHEPAIPYFKLKTEVQN